MKKRYDPIKKAGIYSWTIIGLLILTAGLLYALYIIRIAVLPLLLAIAIAFVLGPFIDLMDRKMPRALAIIIAYLLTTGILFLLFFFGIPEAIDQFQSFLDKLPEYISNLLDFLNNTIRNIPVLRDYEFLPLNTEGITQYVLNQFDNQDGGFLQNVLDITNIIMDLLITLIVGPILSIYLVKDSERLKDVLLRVAPDNHKKDTREILQRMSGIAGKYLRGRLIVAMIFGVLVFIGLLLLGIDFAYLLAFFAAITTLIPFFGAFLGAVPAVIAAFLVSPLTAVWVVLLFLGLQLAENYLIGPLIMKEQIKLNPGLVIIAIIAGSAAFGVIGLILSVPIAAMIQELLKYFLIEKRKTRDV